MRQEEEEEEEELSKGQAEEFIPLFQAHAHAHARDSAWLTFSII